MTPDPATRAELEKALHSAKAITIYDRVEASENGLTAERLIDLVLPLLAARDAALAEWTQRAEMAEAGRDRLSGDVLRLMLAQRDQAAAIERADAAEARLTAVREQIQKWHIQSRATQIQVMRRGEDGDPLDAEQRAFKAVLALLDAAPVAKPAERTLAMNQLLAYERIDSDTLLKAIRLRDGERLLVLQPFGWHIDGRHIPNAAEQFSHEGVCAEHHWAVVDDFGPYIAIVIQSDAAHVGEVSDEKYGR